MPLITKIQSDLKAAMLARNDLVRDTLRLVMSEMKNRRIEIGQDLDASEQEAVLQRCVKTRRDSVEAYRNAGRADLADREQAEIDVIEGYLPEQMSEEDIRTAVRAAIESTGAKSKKDMGLVMKALMAEHKGRIEGKVAQRLAGELLS